MEETNAQRRNDYPKQLRRVEYYDEELKKNFVFLTNAMDITALEVALLYKNRRSVELFFKWLKQHLKIKKFWETLKMQSESRFTLPSFHIAWWPLYIIR